MPNLDDCSLMKMALEEARTAAELGEVPIGAVLVLNDAVIKGHNRVIMDSDPTAHAEIVVIREAAQRIGNYRLVGSSLYVTLEPCMMCVGAIVQARIGRLVYAAADPRYGAVESMLRAFDFDVNHKPDVCSGVFKEEAGKLLTKFFQARRNGGVPKWS
jgi:tRNA(adenine34) deaminase